VAAPYGRGTFSKASIGVLGGHGRLLQHIRERAVGAPPIGRPFGFYVGEATRSACLSPQASPLMLTPAPRGPLSELVLSWLREQAPVDVPRATALYAASKRATDVCVDDDFQITLWLLYELHYGGFDDVDDRWEWSPACLEVRATLERDLEAHLRASTAEDTASVINGSGDIAARLFKLVDDSVSPPLAGYIQRRATRGEVVEFLMQRSIYNLKEADPHTWAIPRLTGAAKVALVEIQYDEYGAGRPAQQHATMFADTLSACGLDATYGTHIDEVSAVTLNVNNTMSLFGLHRRLRGAAVGHLAAFEATSSVPARRVAMGLRRLGFPERSAAYFDEHIEADAVHEQLAMRSVCAQLVRDDPTTLEAIAFGAAACLYVDGRAGQFLLDGWTQGVSTLRGREDLPEVVGA